MTVLPFVFDPSTVPPRPTNLDVALDLARRGIAVFPCQPDKRPFYKFLWRELSTTDEDIVRGWWGGRYSEAIPAIDLAKTPWMVVDIDGRGGHLDWRELTGEPMDAPGTDTPRGGRHGYYRRPDDSYGNSTHGLPPKRDGEGIDIRGHGGYVIAPGATLPDGRFYAPDGNIEDAPPLPEWLAKLLRGGRGERRRHEGNGHAEPISAPLNGAGRGRRQAYADAALEAEAGQVGHAPRGGRNEALNQAAFSLGQLIAGGCLDESTVRMRLEAAADACGLTRSDGIRSVRATIASGLKAGAREPREPPEDWEAALGAEISAALQIKEVATEPEPVREDTELPVELTRVPGLLGDITEWICNTARHPQPGLALGAALTVIGTAAGRHIAGPTRSGTHLYVIGLAPTGAGKDHPLQQIAALLSSAAMRHHIGPSQFISMPAVINFLVRSPLSVCAMDEFGSFMKRINSRRASGFEGAISGILRTAWGSSFKPMTTPEWAGKQCETIIAPSLSIYGVSTAEDFYESLEGADTSNGVLNRLLVFQTDEHVSNREPIVDPLVVPDEICEGLKAIYGRQGPIVSAQLNRYDERPPMAMVRWGDGAEDIYNELLEDVRLKYAGDAQVRAFYVRAAEIAVRVATIRAVGESPVDPVLTREAMEWAVEVSVWSSRTIQRGGRDYIADSENQTAANAVRRAIREAGGRMRHRDLLRRLNHRIKNRDLQDIIRALVEAEQIALQKVVPEKGGPPTFWYTLITEDPA